MRAVAPVIILAFAALSVAHAEQADAPYRSAVRLVLLQVTVRNSRGEAVTDLDRAAFAVYENGTRQPIAVFRREDAPVSIGLLIDNSGSMRTLRSKVEGAALAFARASNAMDEMFVVNFADKVQLDVPFTSDVRVLERGIARADSIGGTALWDAIDVAQSYLATQATRQRRVLVAITDGVDNASVTKRADAIRAAQREDTAIDAVGLFGAGDPKLPRGRHDLDDLTQATGGFAYYPADVDQVERAVLDLARQIRNQYVIAYAPLNQALDGRYRTIRVTATQGREHLHVQTRAGYVASSR